MRPLPHLFLEHPPLMNDTKLSQDDLIAAFKADVTDAVSFIDSDISPQRAAATRFYNAEPFGDEEEGRSQIVKPVVRDTVRATLPSLMRTFFGGKRVVEFTGTNATSAEYADEMTETVNYVFTRQNPGFQIAWDAFKDALVRKVGWVKWWWDESVHIRAKVYTGATEEQLADLEAELLDGEELEIIEGEVAPGQGEMPIDPLTGQPAEPAMLFKCRIISKRKCSRARVEAVPPEEIIISRDARSVGNCRLVGQRCMRTRGELAAMGISPEVIEAAGGGSGTTGLETNPERIAREINSVITGNVATATEDQQKILYIEAYYRIDADGDGISELRRICTVGDNFIVAYNEYADEVQLAAFCPDPEPHTVWGLSQADNVMDLQLINSHVVRDMLDSLKASIFPRMAYIEGQANVDDVLNTEIGAAIRMRSAGAVTPLEVPFLGQQALPILDWLDSERESRTGLSKNSIGLDPRALQSTNQVAVNASVTAAQAQVELIARIFAETGMKRVFRGIAKMLIENQKVPMQVPIGGELKQVNPTKWDVDAELAVDTGLGTGSNDAKLSALNATAASQTLALDKLGLENPLCSLQELYYTQTQILQLSGFRDVHRFWRNPADAAKTMEPKQPEPTPEQVLAEAQMKIEAGKLDVERLKVILEDDRTRDKNEAEVFLKASEIQLKYGAQLDLGALKAIITRQRSQASEVGAVE
jgi:hypothetical protein